MAHVGVLSMARRFGPPREPALALSAFLDLLVDDFPLHLHTRPSASAAGSLTDYCERTYSMYPRTSATGSVYASPRAFSTAAMYSVVQAGKS